MQKLTFIIILIYASILPLNGQNKAIDSLRFVLKNTKIDTIKARLLNEIVYELYNTGNYEEAIRLAEEAKSIFEEAGNKFGIGGAYHQLGCIYDDMGNNVEALKNYGLSLEIRIEIDDKIGIANTYNNIGIIYMNQGNYPKALQNYYASLKIKEELGHRKEAAATYGNIGIIHDYQGNYAEAVNYYLKCKEIMQETGNKRGVAACYNNIGLVYYAEGNLEEALKNHLVSLKIRKEIDDKMGVVTSYTNLGELYLKQKNYQEALNNYFVALNLAEEIGDMEGIADACIDIGKIYSLQHKIKESKTYLKKGLSKAKEIGYNELIRNGYKNLSELESEIGNWKEAHQNYLLYITYRDSIDNEDYKQKNLEMSMQYEFDKKAAADSTRHAEAQKVKDAQLAVQEAQIEEDRIKKYALFGGLGLVIVFAGFIFNRFRVTRRQKEVIQSQKEIVEEQKLEVEHQKLLVEEKNRDIIDSIHYAKRIQDALLKEEEQVSAHLPEHFIYFKPKDIVSGDFYWGLEKQGHWYLAAADCTGHGVPGAFLTMLGTSFLNEINATDKLLSPAEILDQLRGKFIRELGQTGKEGENKDGMDISLVRLKLNSEDYSQNQSSYFELEWSGANNPLWIVNSGRTRWPEKALPPAGGEGLGGAEIKPNKQPIGFIDDPLPFTNHSLQLQKGDTFYIFSDGFADQFGGERGKKYRYKQLKETMLSMAELPLAQQRNKLHAIFEEWKGNLEQVDDVCIIGVRL